VFVGNFGVSEILIVLGLVVVLFGIPRRSKLRRKAGERLDKTKDAVGAVKGAFLGGLRDEPKKAEPVVVRADPPDGAKSKSKRWGRRSR
jgi:Sec-independent protein translocase protein TatA